jgi:hypothetical protein
MVTSIQVTKELLEELKLRKLHDSESYEEVIMDLLEDSKELSEETKADLAKARTEYKEGKVSSLAQVKKEMGL